MINFKDSTTSRSLVIKKKTVINCSESREAGVHDSEKVHLENLIFEKCSALQESTSINITSTATLQFYTSILYSST